MASRVVGGGIRQNAHRCHCAEHGIRNANRVRVTKSGHIGNRNASDVTGTARIGHVRLVETERCGLQLEIDFDGRRREVEALVDVHLAAVTE